MLPQRADERHCQKLTLRRKKVILPLKYFIACEGHHRWKNAPGWGRLHFNFLTSKQETERQY